MRAVPRGEAIVFVARSLSLAGVKDPDDIAQRVVTDLYAQGNVITQTTLQENPMNQGEES